MTTHNTLSRYRFKLQLSTLAMLVMMFSVITYSFNIGYNMTSKYTPLMDATMEIQIEATTAHLWFEEIVRGDRSSNIGDVYKNIENAKWYAQSMISGGTNEKRIILPLQNIDLVTRIKSVIKKLSEFKDATDERYNFISEAGVGSKYDQKYPD